MGFIEENPQSAEPKIDNTPDFNTTETQENLLLGYQSAQWIFGPGAEAGSLPRYTDLTKTIDRHKFRRSASPKTD